MATTWRAAPSVARALAEATERWPGRNRASDGIIGDAAHSARESDHNPDQRGVVHAFDLTHDPAHGVDCNRLAEHLRQVRDPRVRYVIWDGRLYRGPWSDAVLAGRASPWRWEPYRGVNPHTKHMHVSVGYSADAENDTSPWWDLEDEMPGAQDILTAIAELRRDLTVYGTKGLAHSVETDANRSRHVTAALLGTSAPEGPGVRGYERSALGKLDTVIGELGKLAERLAAVEQALAAAGGGGGGGPAGVYQAAGTLIITRQEPGQEPGQEAAS